MQTVNIAELKNNLSHYLRQVRQGVEITIKDRERIIARIIPASPSQDYDEELLELAAQGKATLPEVKPDEAFINEILSYKLPRVRAKGKMAKGLLQKIFNEERDGR